MLLFANVRKFFAVTPLERSIFLQSVILLPATNLGLKVLGLKGFQTILDRASHSQKDHSVTDNVLGDARIIARMVQAASRHGIFTGQCLQQSLVLWWVLRRHGLESSLRIGMQKEQDSIKGHAWVELGGAVLNDTEDVGKRFKTLLSWNASEPFHTECES
jgi:hypothetical protein